MKILCSDGRGEMDTSNCLSCALSSGNPPCGFDYSLLKSLFNNNEQESRKNEIHVTDLTGCLLKAYYDKTNPPAEYVHEKLTRWMGNAVHTYAEASDEYMDSEIPLKHGGIVGKSDVVYKNGRVTDLKTSRWLYPSKLPYSSHALQVNIYAWMLRGMGREVNQLQIQYIDMSGPTKCRACRVPVRKIDGVIKCPTCLKTPSGAHLGAMLVNIDLMTDEEVESRILERKEHLDASIQMGLAPEPEPGYLCPYCPSYNINCWPEASE